MHILFNSYTSFLTYLWPRQVIAMEENHKRQKMDRAKEDGPVIIDLEEDFDLLHTILFYIYTDRISFAGDVDASRWGAIDPAMPKPCKVDDILYTAGLLGMDKLGDKARTFIYRSCTAENITERLFAKTSRDISRIYVSFYCNNWDKIKRSRSDEQYFEEREAKDDLTSLVDLFKRYRQLMKHDWWERCGSRTPIHTGSVERPNGVEEWDGASDGMDMCDAGEINRRSLTPEFAGRSTWYLGGRMSEKEAWRQIPKSTVSGVGRGRGIWYPHISSAFPLAISIPQHSNCGNYHPVCEVSGLYH